MARPFAELAAMTERGMQVVEHRAFRVESVTGKGDWDKGSFRLHNPAAFAKALEDRLCAMDNAGYQIGVPAYVWPTVILIGKRKE